MVGFAPEAADHIDDIRESSGLERLCGAERAVALLTAADQFGVLRKILRYYADKLRVGRHAH